MQDPEEIRGQFNATRLQFINTELDLADTFLSVAKSARLDTEKSERTLGYARTAYETVTHLLRDAELSPVERSKVESRLGRLKSALE